MSIKGSNNEPRIPTFIRKLWDMVNDQKISDVISWSSAHDNKAFIIWDPVEFTSRELPRLLKHCNYSGFVKQLTNYGFRKVEPTEEVYAHDSFVFGCPHLLRHVQRTKRRQLSAEITPPPVLGLPQPSPSPPLGQQPLITQNATKTSMPTSGAASPSSANGDLPKIHNLVMQLAVLQIQAEESKHLVEAFKEEVQRTRDREQQLEQLAQELVHSATSTVPQSPNAVPSSPVQPAPVTVPTSAQPARVSALPTYQRTMLSNVHRVPQQQTQTQYNRNPYTSPPPVQLQPEPLFDFSSQQQPQQSLQPPALYQPSPSQQSPSQQQSPSPGVPGFDQVTGVPEADASLQDLQSFFSDDLLSLEQPPEAGLDDVNYWGSYPGSGPV